MTKNALNKYGPISVPLTVFILSMMYQRHKEEEYRTFHNKSALYGGRDLKPGERIWWHCQLQTI